MTNTKSKDLKKLLESTGRTLYIIEKILEQAPEAEGKIEFFTIGEYISGDNLEKEYEKRGLVPAPIRSLAEYDLTNRKRMDEMKYVATHFKDKNDDWCSAAFLRWDGGRSMHVYRRGHNWHDRWWFGGLRKSGTQTPETQSFSPLELGTSDHSEEIEILESVITRIKYQGRIYKLEE